ncbi:hypothetical protein EDD85DRAFT_792875 [Armillaria nabsnona]|nr:hypothetical protein EDD85DRAFT_792875 [Armillaria nabsnona]
MVMPLLKLFHEPESHCWSEFVDAFRQLLEGLNFMQSQHHSWVSSTKLLLTLFCGNFHSHSDVSPLNFLMDSSKVCPKGYHYASKTSYDSVHWTLLVRPHCRIGPVQYYIIDFESAQEYPAGKETALTTRHLCCDIRSSPEFSLGELCNPFKLDVYNAGATFFELCKGYQGLDDFKPLLLDMMYEDLLARPDMDNALWRLDGLISSNDKVWLWGRIWRLLSVVKVPGSSSILLK